jgi:YHS domain-containing protein
MMRTLTTWEAVMVRDPVCGMPVDDRKPAATASHDGKTYYFCSASCKTVFERTPGKYVTE